MSYYTVFNHSHGTRELGELFTEQQPAEDFAIRKSEGNCYCYSVFRHEVDWFDSDICDELPVSVIIGGTKYVRVDEVSLA